MSNYAPASSLGWLDFDAVASERVSTLLRSLDEPATLDVLGLGTVRDAFSDMLTPGTSTVQTRLRYFIFLSWIFQHLEAEQVPPAEHARTLREAEVKLIDCLKHLGRGQGVIGRVAGKKLKRMPSDIYWGSMEAWGIRRPGTSMGQYEQHVTGRRRLGPERDDDGNATRLVTSIWTAIPGPPENFLDRKLTFELTPDEAQVLTAGIRRQHPNTLVAVLSELPNLPLDASHPWELRTRELPDPLAQTLHHARCFSEVTLGPRLVYNVLLAREARRELDWDTKELEDDQLGKLEDWSRLIAGRSEALGHWADRPGEFWQILAGYGISGTTQRYWDDMARRVIDDPRRFAEDPTVHRLIRDRERRLKSKRARLSYRAALENWNQVPVGGQLDYRWGITKTYLQDLAAAGVGA